MLTPARDAAAWAAAEGGRDLRPPFPLLHVLPGHSLLQTRLWTSIPEMLLVPAALPSEGPARAWGMEK